MRDCNVLNIYYIHAIFVNRFLYCNNNTTPRRKYMKSNVLYVVTQGHNYVILKQLLVFLGSIYFFSENKSLMSYVILRVLFPDLKLKSIADNFNFSNASSSTFLYAL